MKFLNKIFSNPTPLKRILIGGIVGLFFGLILVFFYMFGTFEELELLLSDFRTVNFTDKSTVNTKLVENSMGTEQIDISDEYKIKEDREVLDGDIIYMLVDDTSLNQIEEIDGHAYPWPRSVWGEMTNFLYASNIKSLVYDISFFQGHTKYDRNGEVNQDYINDEKFANTLKKYNDTVLATAFLRSAGKNQFKEHITKAQELFADGLFKDALQRIIFAYISATNDKEEATAEKLFDGFIKEIKEYDKENGINRTYANFKDEVSKLKKAREETNKKLSKFIIKNMKTDDSVIIEPAVDVEEPMNMLLGKPYSYGPANTLGDVKLINDTDGVARRTPLITYYEGNYYPSLTLAGVMEALKFDPSIIEMEIKDQKLYLGNKEKARKDFPEYKNKLKEKIKEFDYIITEELEETLTNITKMLDSVDINKDVPVSDIEQFLRNTERDFAKIDMLFVLMQGYIDFKKDKYNQEKANLLQEYLDEAFDLLGENGLFTKTRLNARHKINIRKTLSDTQSKDYDKSLESIQSILDAIPREVYYSFSLIMQQISIHMSRLSLINDFEQGEPRTNEVNINDIEKVLKDLKDIAYFMENCVRKINEVKNAREIPLDESGMLRLKYYGKHSVLPNVPIYKAIKTWAGINSLWKNTITVEITELFLQYLKNDALIYASENPKETIIKEKVGNFYLSNSLDNVKMPSSRQFPYKIIRTYGKKKLVMIMIEELEKILGEYWFYIIKNMDKGREQNTLNSLVSPLKDRSEFSTATDEELLQFINTTSESLFNMIWHIQSPNKAVDNLVNDNSLETILDIIIEKLEKYNPNNNMHWAVYYSYNDNQKELDEILKEIGREINNNDEQNLVIPEEFNITANDWTDFVKTILPEMVKNLKSWASDNMYDILFSKSEDDISKFFIDFVEELKQKSYTAYNLLKQKVFFAGVNDIPLTIEYGNETNETERKENALNKKLSMISLGANLLEEYSKLTLVNKGDVVTNENISALIMETLSSPPDAESRILVNALLNIMRNKDTPSEVKTVMNNLLLVNPSKFKDKVVLVLTNAASLLDLRKTPFYHRDAGGNIHGHGIMNILNNDYVKERNREGITIPIVLIMGVLIGIAALLLPIRYSIYIFLGMFALYNGFAIALHYFYDMFINMSVVSINILVAFLAGITLNFVLESKQKGFIEGAFSQFLAPEILDKLMKDPTKLTLGGETKELTIFFSDIAGFTTISEKLENPADLVEILNYYLTKMAEIIVTENNGYVDKYEGDAIMAFWGAPVDEEQHAIKACYAALDNQHKLKDIQDYFQEKGLGRGISIRIGLNTGEVVVGMMGSQKKLNYTVIGDAVNLASRLEGANKQFGTEIMISEHTYKHVKDHVEVRELDLLRVKGKNKPTRVYELIARKGKLDENKAEILKFYNQGLEYYRKREFKRALEYFEKALEINPDDGPSKTYLERTKEYIKDPPPEDWDGVFVMKTK